MKSIITGTMLFLSLTSFAFPIFTITNTSWSDTVNYGSSQWIDVKVSGSYNIYDSATVYLFNTATEGKSNPIFIRLIKMAMWVDMSSTIWSGSKWVTIKDSTGFLTIPKNIDGITRRVYFTMPSLFPSGQFSVNMMDGADVHGMFPSPTGIDPVINSQKRIKQINYYNLLGQSIITIEGICIREIIYTDATIERRKIYGTQAIR